MNKNKDELILLMDNIADEIKKYTDLIGDDTSINLSIENTKFKNSFEDIINTNRVLKIGVVGQVKAGKSSFLNAIIFDGNSILPKAATPMTAALSKISYSENQMAKVVFYSEIDWKEIDTLSKKYDKELEQTYNEMLENAQSIKKNKEAIDENTKQIILKNAKAEVAVKSEKKKSCKELTDMVINNNINPNGILDTVKEIEITDAQKDLQQYVGANGKYTPLVKHIELKLNNELLKGYEIVDTPGLNDPILSRGEATESFLINCDVVFILCYTGQFLTNEDVQFIKTRLRDNNIKEAFLVGTKIDSAIRDVHIPRGKEVSLKDAAIQSSTALNQHAKNMLGKYADESADNKIEILSKLSKQKIHYISSILYNMYKSMEKGLSFTDEEKTIINGLNRYKGFELNDNFLKGLSGIDSIKNTIFKDIRGKKQSIIEEKSSTLFKSQKDKMQKELSKIVSKIEKNLDDVKKYEKDGLENQLSIINEGLKKCEHKINFIFQKCILNIKKGFEAQMPSIERAINTYSNLQVSRNQKEVTYNDKERFLIFFTRNVKRTKLVVTDKADVLDVVKNIRGFITVTKETLNESMVEFLDIEELKSELKNSILSAFDTSSKDFDEDRIIEALEITLNKISICEIKINQEQYNNIIHSSFSGGYAQDDEIQQLRLLQDEVLTKILENIKKQLNEMIVEISSELEKQGNTFVDNIGSFLEKDIKRLQEMIENKEERMKQFEQFKQNIKRYESELSILEV